MQIKRFREMTFHEKYEVSRSLFRMARETRYRAMQRAHPQWDDAQCRAAVTREFIHGRP